MKTVGEFHRHLSAILCIETSGCTSDITLLVSVCFLPLLKQHVDSWKMENGLVDQEEIIEGKKTTFFHIIYKLISMLRTLLLTTGS